MARKIVLQYYVLVVLLYGGVNATAAMDTNFLLSRGLDTGDVFLVRFAYFLTLVLFDFPTGVLADRLGRKRLVLASCLIFLPSMALYACSWGFWLFAIAAGLSGLAQACASGACEAWFVGRVRFHATHGEEDLLKHRFSRAWALRHFASAGAGYAGAYLADTSMMLPWFFASGIFVIAFVYASKNMEEEHPASQPVSMSGMWTDVSRRATTSFKYGMGNGKIRFLMCAVFGLYFAVMAPNLMWQPYFAQWVPDNTHNGLIWLGTSASLMLGALVAPIVVNGFASDRRALVMCGLVVATGIIGAAVFDFASALTMFFVYQGARGAFGAIKDPFLHQSIEGEEQRAAVAAFESIAYHGGGALGLLTWGILFKGVPIQTAWLISGFALIGFLGIITLLHVAIKKIHKTFEPLGVLS